VLCGLGGLAGLLAGLLSVCSGLYFAVKCLGVTLPARCFDVWLCVQDFLGGAVVWCCAERLLG